MNPLLTLEHVGFAYHQAEGETPALSDISFTLEAGHFQAIVEASGNMSLERVPAVAVTGVDVISVGALTHSVRSIDLGLDWN